MGAKLRLEGVYREKRSRIVAWLRGRVGDERAQDILHDVVARAFANIDALEPVRDLAAWLWRSARNAAIDVWRSRDRRVRAGEVDLEDFDAVMDEAWNHADGIERAELLDALSAAIASLPEEQRQVVEAQSLRGETFASLSSRTGLPLETLAARKRYALARLRKSLADYCL